MLPTSREKILDVAEARFAQRGYAGVGLREVAEAAGLGKSGQLVLGYAELVRAWWANNLSLRPNQIVFSEATYLSNGGVRDRLHGFGCWEKKADEALVLIAQTQVGYTTVESPIDGRAGVIRLREGNLIKAADDVPLTTVVQLAPIYVTFALPEQYLAEIRRGVKERTLTVLASDPKDAHKLGEGTVTFIANSVDAVTGTITLKATFPNADQALWPGSFVDVVLRLDTHRGVLVVPSPAVTRGQQGSQVFVVKSDQTVEPRIVTVIRTAGQESILAGGIEPGEKVITIGQSRLLPGSKVTEK